MSAESAKAKHDSFGKGRTVSQAIALIVVVVPALYALWSWRDGMVLEKASLEAHLIQTQARSKALAESLARAESQVLLLQQTNQQLRADVARQSGQDSRAAACAFIQKQIAGVKIDISTTRNLFLAYGESKEAGEERSRHLAHLADQLRTLTVSHETCAR